MGPLTPEQIERFRQIGLRLDREGRFWHDGAEVTHPGLRRALLGWLDVLPDGRAIVRLDERRYAYVDVDDAHLLATSVTWRGDRAELHLSDGSDEELAYDTLVRAPDHALYCRVKGGRLEARLTTQAYYTLVSRVRDQDGTFVLEAAGQTWPIAPRQRRPGAQTSSSAAPGSPG